MLQIQKNSAELMAISIRPDYGRLLESEVTRHGRILRQGRPKKIIDLETEAANYVLAALIRKRVPIRTEDKPRMWWCSTERLYMCQHDLIRGKGTTRRGAWDDMWRKYDHP
jgi:hypothetical protein